MWILYDIAFLVFSLFSLPRLLRPAWRRTLPERLGHLPPSLRQGASRPKGPLRPRSEASEARLPAARPRLWLHAVSLGEALAARPLIERLRQEFPGMELAFSTTTLTGRSVLERLRRDGEPLFWFPFDLHWITRRLLRQIRPGLFVMTETELWPNLLLELRRHKIPAVLVNGRLSKRSFRAYRWIRPLLRPALEGVRLFCMQTEEDACRMKALGIREERLRVVGNMKFDAYRLQASPDPHALRRRLGLREEDLLWVAGSTHRGEEPELLEAFRDLHSSYPTLKLLLAPRHPERSQEVARLSEQKRLRSSFFSQSNHPPLARLANSGGQPSPEVLILDTVGELVQMYGVATVVFIGGSLIPHGGQNLLEPAFFARPILFGPHMENFQDIATLFLRHQAACQVHNRAELVGTLKRLLEKGEEREALGERARRLVMAEQGATERTVACLREAMP